MKSLKLAGKDLIKHKSAIADADLIKIKAHLRKTKENPQGLHDKVLIDLMFHFGRRVREGLRELRKDSFEFAVDGEGMEYVTLAYNEHDKNHHDLDREAEETDKQMYAEEGELYCPVSILKLYQENWSVICKIRHIHMTNT